MSSQLRTYGPWNYKEDLARCVTCVYPPGLEGIGSQHQCYRKRGHGPGELYCRQHAKLAEPPAGRVRCATCGQLGHTDCLGGAL